MIIYNGRELTNLHYYMEKNIITELMSISTSIIYIANCLIKEQKNPINIFKNNEDIIVSNEDIIISNDGLKENQNEIKVKFKREIEPKIKFKNKEEIILQKGSITKRKDGRYMGRFRIDGKEKCVYAKTKYECALKLKKAMEESKKEKEENTNQISSKMKFESWLIYWTNYYKKPTIRESSYFNLYNDIVKITNMGYLNNISLDKINRLNIIDFLDKVESADSKRRFLAIFKQSLESAYNDGLCPTNFASNIKIQFDGRKEQVKEALTKEQELTFIKTLGNKNYKYFFLFLLYTGMRKGEALALTWNDIDFENNTINIDKSFATSTATDGKTKTLSGNRVIPLFPNVKPLLIAIKNDVTIDSTPDRVFAYIAKYKGMIEHIFKRVCLNANITTRIHNLRHTFITRCYEAGIDEKVIQKWVGHKSISTTLNVYTHVSSDIESDAEDKLTRIFNNIDTNVDTH